MGWTCSKHGDEKHVRNFSWNTWRKDIFHLISDLWVMHFIGYETNGFWLI
jgi:hypothetical protein